MPLTEHPCAKAITAYVHDNALSNIQDDLPRGKDFCLWRFCPSAQRDAQGPVVCGKGSEPLPSGNGSTHGSMCKVGSKVTGGDSRPGQVGVNCDKGLSKRKSLRSFYLFL